MAPGDADDALWCPACRAGVIRRASVWGRVVGIMVGGGFGAWIVFGVSPSRRFLIVWLALVAAAYWLSFKIGRRVAFEVVRSRGVPPETRGEP
ncbi:MAG: hypothetical protein ACREKN_07650 [Longimicrobiaceae bacterium]